MYAHTPSAEARLRTTTVPLSIVPLVQQALKNDPSMTEINLSSQVVNEAEWIRLFNVLSTHSSIKTLQLNDCALSAGAIKALATMLFLSTSLTKIELRGNQISANSARVLANALQNNNALISLDIRANHIGSLGAYYLAEGLQGNRVLKRLYMDNNRIGYAGRREMGRRLICKQTALEYLDLPLP